MPKSYLQVSEYYPTCINGSLTVYIAGTTELATVFNPISGAEISNPIPIGSDGYVQAYNVLNGVYYDVFAKDANGAVRFERQNIFPNGDRVYSDYQFTKNYREENIPVSLCLPLVRNTFSQPVMFLERKIVNANFLARSVQFGAASDHVSQILPISNGGIYKEHSISGELTKIADLTQFTLFPQYSKRIATGKIKNGPDGDFLSLKGGDEIWIGYTDAGTNPSAIAYAHTKVSSVNTSAKTFNTTLYTAPDQILKADMSDSASVGWVGISANEYYWSV